MAGSISTTIAAETLLIMAGKLVLFLAPVFAVAALWWLATQIDVIIARLFPHLKWEKDLGWLNLRAERRAKTAVRWIGYAVYLLLGLALIAMTSATREVTDQLSGDMDSANVALVVYNLGVIWVCVGAWVTFLGCWLIPKIRNERELAALRKFRAQVEEEERERESRRPRKPSPFVSQYKKPRANSVEEVLSGRSSRLRPPPGG